MSFFKSRNLLLVLALLFAFALAVAILLRYQPDRAVKTVIEAMPEGIDLSLKEIDYTHIEGGIARWRLQAEQVEHQVSNQSLEILKPHLDFFDEQGNLQGTLDAQAGEVSQDYQRVKVKGQVVLQDKKGYTFFTDTLDYDHTRHLVSTDDDVTLVSKGLKLAGRGLKLDTLTRHLSIRADVTAFFEPQTAKRK